MREIEVKILEVNREEVENKLIDLGANKILDDELYAIRFSKKEHLLEKGILLRLRKEGLKTKLTVKKSIKNKNVKAAHEYEVEVENFEETKKILETLGFEKRDKLKKHRTSYQLKNVRFEFDKYLGEQKHVPEFLEIEAHDEKTIFKYVKILGFKKEDCKPWSSTDVIKHYRD
ncbi:MAG: CYTH domain-containing protein [archaeon]